MAYYQIQSIKIRYQQLISRLRTRQ